MNEAGLEVRNTQVLWGTFTQESGYKMTEDALADTPRPTALVAANNFIAIGAMGAMQEQGFHVPEDVALVAVDDIPSAFTINPFLTVATQPAREMGHQATRLLLDIIKKEADRQHRHIVLPTEMIIRTSSGDRIAA
jgi:LacI family transcriptional regulator